MGWNGVGSVVGTVGACVLVGSAVDDFWLAIGGI
jgi:hypothetical protein